MSLYANAMFLHARFVSGPRDGKTPQYAPDVLIRGGGIYHWNDNAKLALLGTYVDNEFADDNNSRSPDNNCVRQVMEQFDVTREQIAAVLGFVAQSLMSSAPERRVASAG